jgi:predicted Zn-dependent protease
MAYNPYQQQQDDNEDSRYPQQRRHSFPRDNEPEYPAEQGEDPRQQQQQRGYPQPRGGGGSPVGGLLAALLRNPRVAMALAVAAFGVFKYMTDTRQETSTITDQKIRVPWEKAKDVALGMQAAPGMIQQHGGEHRDQRLQAYVDQVGMKLVKSNAVGDWAGEFNAYQWDFHLLADEETINAFALPGGQIFFTYGLFKRLTTEDQVAGVLGHEIGHVIGRHSAQQMAKSQAISSIATGVSILTSGQQGGGQGGQILNHVLNSKYGRGHETQSDELGVQFMVNADYNPEGLIDVMKILKEASGGRKQPEFMSTHPDPGNRIEAIKAVIEQVKSGALQGPVAVSNNREFQE